MGNNSQDSDASAPDSSSDDSNSPPPAKSGSSSSPPPPEKSSPSPPSSPPPSPPSSPPPSPPSSPPPSPPIKSPTLTPPSAGKISPPAPPGASASVSPPPVKKPPTTPAVPDSDRKPTPSGSVPASRGGGSSSSSSSLVPDNDQQSKGGSSNNTGLIAGVVVGVVLLLVIAGLCVAIFRRKKKKKSENQIWDSAYNYPDKYHAVSIPPQQGNRSSASYQSGWPQPVPPPPLPGPTSGFHYSTGVQQQAASPGSSPAQMSSGGSHGFSFDDLVAATNGFSSANMLGQGGFGFVHKGVLPNTGKVVAVKSLKSGSGQGEREFQSEVEIISRVHHRHLVSLVGYCISAAKRLLVYEFVPNNTLEFHLHQSGNVLDFSARLRIALGAAKGLAYLHEDCHPRIIHRDIKASNILLDYNFEAQVADFGLAKLTSDNNTHVSTRVMGTFGYLAPEYASSGKLTEKSDVFSFGVMLLELITGRRPVDPNDYNMMEDSLVDWARPLLTKALADKNYDALADPRLERNYNAQDMLSMVACAASSIRHSSKKRPRMSQIVRALEGQMSLDKLLEGGSKTTKSSDYDTAAYKADMSKFREIALGGSGDSSNDTSTNASSEFNLHT